MITHGFIICAYKESEYLEKCIRSLKRQTVKSKIAICTSTPNEHISQLAKKYDIDLFVRNGKSDIQEDWNYGANLMDLDWVTVAHQDDIYNRHYAESVLKAIRENPQAILTFTDYKPIHNNKIRIDANSIIRHILCTPMRVEALSKNSFVKKYFLAFGNAICCSSVTYNRRKIGNNIFDSKLKFSLDWDIFVKLSKHEGRFVYINKPLTYFRIHKDATTAHCIENKTREIEDLYMFRQFWPEFICKLLMVIYKLSYKNYER